MVPPEEFSMGTTPKVARFFATASNTSAIVNAGTSFAFFPKRFCAMKFANVPSGPR